jgi:hypothetical protein
MDWSENVKSPPESVDAKSFDCVARAYPFKDSSGFIEVDDASVKFTGQRGPIKENGVNGCQIDDMIVFAKGTIQCFNTLFPCKENTIAITKLEEVLLWLDARKKNRTRRGVEGLNKK